MTPKQIIFLEILPHPNLVYQQQFYLIYVGLLLFFHW